jgi:SHS2 domain-containing protein
MSSWEHFSHDADIGIRGIGKSLEEAFEMAGLSLTAVVTSLDKISPQVTISIHCKEHDVELLFYDWINELIYEMDTKKILFNKFRVHISNGSLDAECEGQRVNSVIHDPAVDVKGATMTELKVVQNDHQWIAQCIVDV